MSNPPPRPALRKSPDSDVHPALPPRALAPVAPATPTPEPVALGAGSTSDTLRPSDSAPGATSGAERMRDARRAGKAASGATTGKDQGPGKGGSSSKGAKKAKDAGKPKRRRARDIAVPAKHEKDKTVVVEVPMPKSLRRGLDERAESLGYTREETLVLLLRAWIDG